MGFQGKIRITLCIFAFIAMTSAEELQAAFKESVETFSNNLFHELFLTHNTDNVIYSPLSIHTCLAMARAAAEGETATEMDIALALNDQSIQSVANNYHSLLEKYENSPILQLANKLYVKHGHELNSNYNELLRSKFFTNAEEIDFTKSNQASRTINTWIDTKTHHMIKDLVQPSMFGADTSLMLLSAVHFKGAWEHPFKKKQTAKKPFYIDENSSVEVDMMFTSFCETSIMYGREPDFHYIRMPYKDSDLSMMVFVPWKRTGLAALMATLKKTSLDKLIDEMYEKDLDISMPKFKVEFEIELNEPLQKLGMIRLFKNAQLGEMLKSHESLTVSKVVHKAVIEVTEKGTKASAATGLEAQNYNMPFPFTADHPFYYAILNEENVIIFQGTVVNF